MKVVSGTGEVCQYVGQEGECGVKLVSGTGEVCRRK